MEAKQQLRVFKAGEDKEEVCGACESADVDLFKHAKIKIILYFFHTKRIEKLYPWVKY